MRKSCAGADVVLSRGWARSEYGNCVLRAADDAPSAANMPDLHLAIRSGCPRYSVAMRLWRGTLLGGGYALRTSGVAFPFVLERLSNTPPRPQEASPRIEPWEAV